MKIETGIPMYSTMNEGPVCEPRQTLEGELKRIEEAQTAACELLSQIEAILVGSTMPPIDRNAEKLCIADRLVAAGERMELIVRALDTLRNTLA